MRSLETETINVLLKQRSKLASPEFHADLIWDGAGSHTGQGLEIPANISLIRLPPYAPEPNYRSNRTDRDWETLKRTASESLVKVGNDRARIKLVFVATSQKMAKGAGIDQKSYQV